MYCMANCNRMKVMNCMAMSVHVGHELYGYVYSCRP